MCFITLVENKQPCQQRLEVLLRLSTHYRSVMKERGDTRLKRDLTDRKPRKKLGKC